MVFAILAFRTCRNISHSPTAIATKPPASPIEIDSDTLALSQQQPDNDKLPEKQNKLTRINVFIGLPAYDSTEQVVHHYAYTLSYNEQHEQPDWVAYRLTAERVKGTVKRTDDFRPDELIKTGSAELEDYKYSGYDRGHLVPAGDMKWSEQAMSESFLLSNVSPQNRSFNSGVWNELEISVREAVAQEGELWIVTGPVLKEGLKTIGQNKVSVPEEYFKVVLDYQEPGFKCIGFVIPNEPLKGNLFVRYAMPVDSVEALTGLDFFHELPDSIENELEADANLLDWWRRK